jgi:RimK family alpha-L-glutamate ligase
VKGYIIERYNDMNNLYTCQRLIEEANRLKMALDIMGVHDTYEYGEALYNNSTGVEQRDFSILRFKEGDINFRLSSLTPKQYNRMEHIESYGNKFAQLKNINSKHMIMPRFILSYLDINIDKIEQLIGTPFVVKSLKGSRGDEVYLVRNVDEYNQLRSAYKGIDKEFIFEEYIEESSGKDIRVFCICGEVVACMKRTAKDGFKANYKLGGDIEPYETDNDIIQIAEDIYKNTALHYAGIDLLFGRDGYVFCEVNVCPGLEGIEKTSGLNIAGRLIASIKDDLVKS